MTDVTSPAVANTATIEPVSPSPDVQAVASPESSDAQPAVTPAADPATAAPAAEISESEHKSRASERIQDLIAERKAAAEYAEFWRAKALEVINQGKPPAEPVAPVPKDRPAPTLDQFNFDQTKWSRALGEWNREQSQLNLNQALEQRQLQEQQQSVMDTYMSNVESFKKDHPDFDLVTSNPRLPALDRVAAAMVLSSEQAAALTYHLASHPEEATRIARLNSTQQALAIGRLEATVRQPKAVVTTPAVQAQPKQAAPVVTQAPPPPEPVPAGGNPQASPENMDIREWMRARAGEAKSRRSKFA
jgi:hypothetical protein